MTIFNSYVSLPEGKRCCPTFFCDFSKDWLSRLLWRRNLDRWVEEYQKWPTNNYWLVVWNMIFFPSIGNVIIPTDFHSIIFQRGRYTGIPPTRLWLFEDFPILIFQHKVPSWQALMRATKNCWKRLQVHRKAWLKFSPFLKQVIDTRDTSWWKRSFSGHVCWGQELL